MAQLNLRSLKSHILVLGLFLAPVLGHAQAVLIPDGGEQEAAAPEPQQRQGNPERAKKYFQQRKGNVNRASSQDGPTPRFLAIHVGRLFADQAYNWGDRDQTNVGGFNAGLTYRLGEWVNSMDFNMRAEYTNYSLDEGSARKVSFLGMITFPDANSHFPLYFGGGIGPGFFIKQIPGRSAISLDYQVIAGARFLNVFDNLGFMVETGIKNHMHLLSSGQYNGVFLNVGVVFAF